MTVRARPFFYPRRPDCEEPWGTDAYIMAVGDRSADESGCDIKQARWPSDCIVPIQTIEAATGLGFFADLTEDENRLLRSASTRDTWMRWVRAMRE